MKYIAYLIIPLVLIALYGGCSECVNCAKFPPNCIFLEDANNSECIAEDIVRACEGYGCRSETYRFSLNRNEDCVIIDCETIQCDDVRSTIPTDDPSIFMQIEQLGTITILGLDESNLPFGFVDVNDELVGNVQEEFDCFFVQP